MEYGHEQAWHDGNGHSHLQATMLGPSLTVPVKDGKLVLGTWQQVFQLECDIKPANGRSSSRFWEKADQDALRHLKLSPVRELRVPKS